MHPIAIVLGVGAAGFAAVKAFGKKAPPLLPSPSGGSAPEASSNVQVQRIMGAGGVPLKIFTPITSNLTSGQKTGVSSPAAPTKSAVPHTTRNSGIVYAPPKAVVMTSDGPQPVPVIQSPTGSSSIAISSVTDVQRALNTLGYAPTLKEDGLLGPKTSGNVRAFQSKSGLVVDGNAGPATKAALSNALSGLAGGGTGAVKPMSPAVLPPGKRDPYNDAWAAPKGPPAPSDVSGASRMSLLDVQKNLNLLGASPRLTEDGKPGAKTVAAIKSFQVGHGLAADGIAGPATKNVIYQLAHAPVKQFTGDFG